MIERYLIHAAFVSTPETLKDRKRTLADFAGAFGVKPVDDCIPLDLEEWLEAHASWRSDWTRRRNVCYVLTCFRWAAGKGLIADNPFGSLPTKAGPRRRPVEAHEWAALCRCSGAFFRRVLLFMRLTGCRPGELSALVWPQVDFDKGLIVQEQHKGRRLARQPLPRVIALHPIALRLLRWLRVRSDGTGYVFRNKIGGRWTRWALSQRMAAIRRRAGVSEDCKLHGIRHGWATDAIELGTPLAVVAELLGHRSTAMTSHYVHLARRRSALSQAVALAVKPLRQR